VIIKLIIREKSAIILGLLDEYFFNSKLERILERFCFRSAGCLFTERRKHQKLEQLFLMEGKA